MSLTIKASALARAAPIEWRAFLAELNVYFEEKKTEMLRAPVAELEKAQGRAQAVMLFIDLLNGAVKDTARIERGSK
jgi:hypothetical protein